LSRRQFLHCHPNRHHPENTMLKYLLFIAFFAVMLMGYFSISVPAETPYAEVLARVQRGMALTLFGGLGCMICVHRITR
jgi:hypothetical protein